MATVVEYKGPEEWIADAKDAIRDYRRVLSILFEDADLEPAMRRLVGNALHIHRGLPIA